MEGSDYGIIPYEVDEITSYLETWLNDNMPGLIEDALPTKVVFRWDASLPFGYTYYGGGWTKTLDVNAWLGYWLVSDSVAGERGCGVGSLYIPIETVYTAHLIHLATNNSGHMHILLNGVDKGYVDFYQSGNAQLVSSVSLGTLSVGHYIVTFWISGKNASSSAYAGSVEALVIAET